jgi:hypothetical protein
MQVSPVGVDDTNGEVAAPISRQHRHQLSSREIGGPHDRSQRDAEARYRRLSDRLRGIRHHAAGDSQFFLDTV